MKPQGVAFSLKVFNTEQHQDELAVRDERIQKLEQAYGLQADR